MKEVWKDAVLSEVLELITNGVNCDQKSNSGKHLVTRIETISKGVVDLERIGRADLNEKELTKYRLIENDILFSHINSPIHVGKTALFDRKEEVYHGVNLLRLRTIKDVNPKFLRYFLLFLYTSGFWRTIAKQSVNQASVNQKDISAVPFSYPSLEKQVEIVEKLDSTFAEIELLNVKQKESAKHVTTLLQSYIDELLLRDQDESVPLTNLAILENGDRGSNYPNKSMREATGVPFINAGHIGEGKLDMSQMDFIAKGTFDKLSRGKIQRNDLLFCLRGSLGKTAILGDLDEGAIASSLVIVRAKEGVNPKFLLYYFLSSICKSEIEEFRSGTAQPNLGGSDLKRFSVPFHSQIRMQEIVTKVDEAASQIDALNGNKNKVNILLLELKQSVLSNAFTQEEAVA